MDKPLAEVPKKEELPKSEAKVLREIAMLLDTGVSGEDLQDIQNACVAGVSPYEIAQEIRRGRARSF